MLLSVFCSGWESMQLPAARASDFTDTNSGPGKDLGGHIPLCCTHHLPWCSWSPVIPRVVWWWRILHLRGFSDSAEVPEQVSSTGAGLTLTPRPVFLAAPAVTRGPLGVSVLYVLQSPSEACRGLGLCPSAALASQWDTPSAPLAMSVEPYLLCRAQGAGPGGREQFCTAA